MNRRTLLVGLTGAASLAAFGGGTFLYRRNRHREASAHAASQSDTLVRPHSPILGRADAPVTIVEFFDPACEACRAFHPYLKQILAAHQDSTRLVIRYTPFHREASVAGVRILEAARAQQRFEPVLEALLQSQPRWASHHAPAIELAWAAAQEAGLDLEQARAHLASGEADRLLERDVADVQAVGVTRTPSFFVDGQPLPTPDPRVLLEMVAEAVARVGR